MRTFYSILNIIFTLIIFFVIQYFITQFINFVNSYSSYVIHFFAWLPFTFIFLMYIHPIFQIIFNDSMVEKLSIVEQFKYRFNDKKIKKKEFPRVFWEMFWITLFCNIIVTIASVVLILSEIKEENLKIKQDILEEQENVSNDLANIFLTPFKIEDLEEIKNINQCSFEEGLEWSRAQNTPDELAKLIENTTKKELGCLFYMGENSKEQFIISYGVIEIESLRKIHKKLNE